MSLNILLLVLPPALFALANLIDKYLVTGDGEDAQPGALIAISSVVNVVTTTFALMWACGVQGNTLICSQTLPLMANGLSYVLAIYLYLHALRVEETSRVVPWLQLIPAFGLVGGCVVLGEFPTITQLFAIVAVIVGGWMLIGEGVARFKFAAMMIGCAALLAVNDVCFAYFGRDIDTATAVGYDMAGKAVWGIFPLLVSSSSRRGFVIGLKTRFGLQFGSELIAVTADACLDVAKIVMPIVIVQAACATQPAFVLVGVVLVTVFTPRILKEEIGREHLIRKTIAIIMTIAGGVALALTIKDL